MQDTIGIDFSKDTFDIHRLSDRWHERFGNDKTGLAALRRWIGKAPVRIVYEATGHYHRDLEAVLGAASHDLVKVNPTSARRFAPAISQGAKTDRVDAAMLTRMGRCWNSRPSPCAAKPCMKSASCTSRASP